MAGGRSPSIVNRRFLLQRIRSCQRKCPTVDDIVDHLQFTYRDYRGLKKSPFSSIVQQTLNSQLKKSPKSTPSTSKPSKVKRQLQDSKDEDVDCSGRGSTIQKKRHERVDVNEQRLQSMENMHLRRIQHSNLDDSSSSLSSNFGNSGEEEVSMSEDAIYGKKVEPEFDLMKSMLRTSYAESNKSKNEHSEESVELEVAINNKVANNNIDVGNEGNTSKRMLRKEGQGSLNGAKTEKGDAKVEGLRLKDFGGMKDLLKQLKKEVIVPFYHSKQLQRLGVKPITGILLHGPPGCGKSSLARAIGNEIGLPFYEISATEVVSGVSGESEENVRELFYKAYRTAPSVVFIDEIDAIASKRENLQKETDRRIVTQLMTCMDGFPKPMNSATSTQKNNVDVRSGCVLVIATTNRPNAIDPALRRSGRFDMEFVLGVPDENARLEILSVLTKNMSFEGSFSLMKIARATSGFVGADLATLTNKASHLAVRRIIDRRERELSMDLVDDMHIDDLWRQPDFLGDVDKLTITMSDFEEAIKIVQPSLVREGFSGIPNVKWEDVGGLERLRIEFDRYIVRRVKYPEDYKGFGMNLEVGILLYGPPGCGKTLIAKAVANEAGANFIYIKGPELLNKYVGESELAIRTLFSRARTCAPCILFFDEVDALTTKRGQEGGWVVERLLNQLLIELDGAEQRQGVFVIGATNRLEVIDPAILRPGRFGKRLYVPLPGPNERGLILKALAREKSIDVSVDLVALGQMEACENFSGADLASLMDEATMVALEEKPISTDCNLDSVPYTIKMSHFERALAKITPSVSKKENKLYQILSNS